MAGLYHVYVAKPSVFLDNQLKKGIDMGKMFEVDIDKQERNRVSKRV
jgi:hypothetical protein